MHHWPWEWAPRLPTLLDCRRRHRLLRNMHHCLHCGYFAFVALEGHGIYLFGMHGIYPTLALGLLFVTAFEIPSGD